MTYLVKVHGIQGRVALFTVDAFGIAEASTKADSALAERADRLRGTLGIDPYIASIEFVAPSESDFRNGHVFIQPQTA